MPESTSHGTWACRCDVRGPDLEALGLRVLGLLGLPWACGVAALVSRAHLVAVHLCLLPLQSYAGLKHRDDPAVSQAMRPGDAMQQAIPYSEWAKRRGPGADVDQIQRVYPFAVSPTTAIEGASTHIRCAQTYCLASSSSLCAAFRCAMQQRSFHAGHASFIGACTHASARA